MACMPIVNVLFISGLGAGLSTQYAGVLTEEIRRSLNKVRVNLLHKYTDVYLLVQHTGTSTFTMPLVLLTVNWVCIF